MKKVRTDLVGAVLWLIFIVVGILAASRPFAAQFENELSHPARPKSPTAPMPF